MIGAMIPKTLFAVAVNALPVPRSFVGKISGVYAYRTAYLYIASISDQAEWSLFMAHSHDVTHEIVSAIPTQESVGSDCSGRSVKEHSGQCG